MNAQNKQQTYTAATDAVYLVFALLKICFGELAAVIVNNDPGSAVQRSILWVNRGSNLKDQHKASKVEKEYCTRQAGSYIAATHRIDMTCMQEPHVSQVARSHSWPGAPRA